MSSLDDAQPSKRPLSQTGAASQSSEHFDGARTKFGRRERKTKDKATKNARVRNSYLKLTMENAVWDQLHRLVQQARYHWDEENKSSDDHSLSVSKKQSKRHLAIKPRSRNSLHMTYFFAGKVLDDMPLEELQRWDAMIRECVLDHSSRFDAGEYCLRFKHLTPFPPQRPNLIAAVFESSPALDGLYEELCNLAIMEKEGSAEEEEGGSDADGSAIKYEFPLLRSLTWKQVKRRKQHHSQPSWIAHVTLGNLAGGSKEDARRLTEWLRDRESKSVDTSTNASNGLSATPSMPDESSKAPSNNNGASSVDETETSSVLESDIKVLGLALGGPVPAHACGVDWTFPFYSADAGK
ncbi:hypothetical protein ACHAXT_011532 [Thalassiosira profunda]